MSDKPLIALFEKHGELLSKFSRRESFNEGDYIFREGETNGDRAYIILEGTVSILRQVRSKEKVLATIGPGEILGEVSLFSDGPRTATARAGSKVEVEMFTRDDFIKLKKEDLAVAYELLEGTLTVVTGRLRSTIQRLEVIYFWLS